MMTIIVIVVWVAALLVLQRIDSLEEDQRVRLWRLYDLATGLPYESVAETKTLLARRAMRKARTRCQ